MRNSIYKYLSLLIICLSFTSFGQRPEKFNGEYSLFHQAEDLFEKEQFSAARKSFSDFSTAFAYEKNDPLYIKAKFYEGLSALELYNNDAVDLLLQFNKDYPESIYKHLIYLKLGKYFYQKKKYKEAVNWLVLVDLTEVEADEKDEYYFKVGYANFQLGNYKAARNAFFEVKDKDSQYASPALYYYSHIAYQNKNYQVALEGFTKLLDDKKYASAVPNYIAQIYYLQGKYDKVTEFAPDINLDKKDANSADLNHLIGDAYYKIGKYDEAVNYLEEYDKLSETTRDDDYQLGYSYYKSNQCEMAVKKFERIARTKDALGQVAMYHTGECYLKLDNILFARNAFESAADLDFDLKIQEDALYNYAILSYKLNYNPYDEAIEAFELYLKKYPNSERKNDVYQYLINVYSTTKNYSAALKSLDKLPTLNIRLKSAYQIIAFNKGIELYERGQFSEAISALQLVKKYPVDDKISGKAVFWIADAYFMQKKYPEAISNYRSFNKIPGNYTTQLKEDAYYNIGYAYFMSEDYESAKTSFRTYTDLNTVNNKKKLADAYARIGDAYYVTKTGNKEAINYYQKSIDLNQGAEDKSLFYQANAYGLIDKTTKKIKTLSDIVNNYPNSVYTTRSIFEIGSSYALEQKFDKALRSFNQLITDYPNNILVKDALLEIGDIKFKQQKFGEAEAFYKRVLDEFNSDDQTCKSATDGLVDIYKALNQVDKISQLRVKYPCAQIEDDIEENIYYDKAIFPYNEGKYVEAIPELQNYITKFPTGRFTNEMKAYLADAYFQTEDLPNALVTYESLLEGNNSVFTELALIRVSKIYYNNGNYEKALPYYTRLEKIASSPEIIYNTRVGLMRTNFLLLAYENAHPAAIEVLKDSQISDEIEVEANYIAGMALYYDKKYTKAIDYLKWTSKNTGNIRGAEAQHTLAASYYELKNYSEAKAEHAKMMKRKPAYDYWVAKSLILQAKVLMAEEELYQAENTVNLVLNNYPIQDDGIITEAQGVKNEIIQLLNKPKSGVASPSQNIIEINEEGGNDE